MNHSEVKKFLEIIGLRLKTYETNITTTRNSYNSQIRSMPKEFSTKFHWKLREVANTQKQRESFGYIRRDRAVGRKVLTQWANEFPDHFSDEKMILDSDLYWDEIVEIEDLGEVPTAGFYVPEHHNYINDVVEHNTIVIAVLVLWYLFTSGGIKDPDTGVLRENLAILALAPQKSQIENLFKRIRTFLSMSPHLSECVVRDVKGSPQLIALRGRGNDTGNQIIGFASGESSGNKGVGARGQDADVIVLDETAFLGEDVILDVIKPILMTKETSRLIAASTPSDTAGGQFEEFCLENPDYKEFYVPASARPDWEKVKDKIRREFGGNEDKWDKEVLAKFVQGGTGVYKKELVRSAMFDYEYGDMRPNQNFIYTLGIDWNKEHGTEIVVLGTQKVSPFISWVVWAENIPKKDFQTPLGIDRIIYLNRFWQPHLIYVDEGGGGDSAVQMFQFYGRDAVGKNKVDARLMKIVKPYNFGANIEIRDHQGVIIKKLAKPFMIENSVRKFELGEVRFPRSDLVLQRQLDNYIVKRRTNSNTPIYGLAEEKWGDHRLDSLNMALVAVRLEMPSLTDFGVVRTGAELGFIPYQDRKEESLSRPPDRILTRSIPTRSLNSNGNVLEYEQRRMNQSSPYRQFSEFKKTGRRTWRR
jgi:hypothetical protein